MTVNEYIKELEKLRPDLKELEIVITAPNGLQFPPQIKQQLNKDYDISSGVKNMIITY